MGARLINRLNADAVRQITERGLHPDGDGLYLQVKGETNRSWIFRYMKSGTPRWMGLGPVRLVSLSKARVKVKALRLQLLEGVDPLEARVIRKAKDAADAATSSPSPSASSTTDTSGCPIATDDEGGIDNTMALPDDPWYLNASSLLLKGADYQGIVKVKTANGTVKKVLKYVISDGTDIGDLHQTVNDEQSGKTYHVQAGSGTTSTIRDGKTVMYTESISGNLLGLIPITFSPDNPPPLNIPLIYFTKVKVVQAGQFGGTLHVPGLHNYTTD